MQSPTSWTARWPSSHEPYNTRMIRFGHRSIAATARRATCVHSRTVHNGLRSSAEVDRPAAGRPADALGCYKRPVCIQDTSTR